MTENLPWNRLRKTFRHSWKISLAAGRESMKAAEIKVDKDDMVRVPWHVTSCHVRDGDVLTSI